MFETHRYHHRAEIPPKKKTDDRQADRFHVNPGHKKAQQREILRNPNLLIKTPKKMTDEQTSRQQI